MTTSLARAATPVKNRTSYEWILSPAIDLLFCCGGLLWLIFAIHLCLRACLRDGTVDLSGDNAGSIQVLIAAGTILLANPHSAATLMRLYGERETRKQLWVCSYIGAAGAILVGAACVLSSQALGFFARIYLILIVHHVLAQVRGIALIYCYKRNYVLNAGQKQSLSWLINSIICLAVMRQFTDSAWHQTSFNSLEIPSLQFLPYWTVTIPAIAAMASGGRLILQSFRRWQSDGSVVPLPAVFLICTIVVAFSLGREMFGGLWLFVPAFFHGSQYLVVTTAYNLKSHIGSLAADDRADPPNFHNISRSLLTTHNLTYWGSLLVIGMSLFGGIPAVLYSVGVASTISLPAVFIAVNLHHFLADHSLWRMRDPKVRHLLVA